MDVRVLRYFLAVAREQSFSSAAERLYLSQPTLSRQLSALEEELGKTLLVRGSKGVTLTEDGMLLRKRAEEIVELMDKTEREVRQSDKLIGGTVYIGAGETPALRLIASTARRLREEYPDIRYSIFSGNGTDVMERLERGLIDFGLVFQNVDTSRYESLELPLYDSFGVLMRKDSPLAERESITVEDLRELPLIIPRQPNHNALILDILGESAERLNVVAEYNLVYNSSVLVREGLGYSVTFDNLINVSGSSDLCFKPLEPPVRVSCSFIWKRYPIFTKAAGKFLERFLEDMDSYRNGGDQ